jgi:hypothetical protein
LAMEEDERPDVPPDFVHARFLLTLSLTGVSWQM